MAPEGFVRGLDGEADPKPAAPEQPAQTAPRDNVVPLVQRSDVWPVRVRLLYRPIYNEKNEEVRELLFREPTGGDINRYGNPVWIDNDGVARLDEPKMMRMMAALSGVLLPFLERMDPRDWNSCAYRLRGFFLPNFAAW